MCQRVATELTVVGVGLDAEALLRSADPRAFITRPRHGAVTDAVAALDASSPLAVVDPATVSLTAEPVTSPVSPFAAVRVACAYQRHGPVLAPLINDCT